jgi:uncharacterized OsmC-like protein
MTPIPLFECNSLSNISVMSVQADLFEHACRQVYGIVFGKPNALPQRTAKAHLPVIAAGVEAGWWQLYCNDPEADPALLDDCKVRLQRLQHMEAFQPGFLAEVAAEAAAATADQPPSPVMTVVAKLRGALYDLVQYLRRKEAQTKDLTLKVEFSERADDAERVLAETAVQHITRQRRLSPEEVIKYDEVRARVAEETPDLVARHHDRMAKQSAGECWLPPPGWRCTRPAGHTGPCAAVPDGSRT